ncbi:hypothetical protein AB0N14_34745 [Streptomyces sp. NPDC051104]|uniref:hypothetical protein n=1 Tax=Streptomyces sp. NPDC051104 TaxID=3155044 RepID=UPI0034381F37
MTGSRWRLAEVLGRARDMNWPQALPWAGLRYALGAGAVLAAATALWGPRPGMIVAAGAVNAGVVGTTPVLSNAGPPVTVATPGGRERLARAESLLLPAALGRVRIEGPVDVLLGYLPDLDLDVRTPLLAAGHGPAAIAALGEGLTPDGSSKPTCPAPGA